MSRFIPSFVGEVPFEKPLGKVDAQRSLATFIERAIEKKALRLI
jgi:hypothetical protein